MSVQRYIEASSVNIHTLLVYLKHAGIWEVLKNIFLPKKNYCQKKKLLKLRILEEK